MRFFSLSSVTAVALLAIPSYAGSTGPGTLQDLGEPVLTVLSHDQALGFGPDGEPQAYFVVGGNANVSAGFAAVEVRSGRTVFETRLPRGDTSWAIDYSPYEKAVYVGMSDASGELYRHRAGSRSVESLGVPVPGERIWGMDVAPDGTVFGGTYPGGRLFSYDPASGRVHDFGQAVAGETYVRGLEATAEHTIDYRALDRAFNATPITTRQISVRPR